MLVVFSLLCWDSNASMTLPARPQWEDEQFRELGGGPHFISCLFNPAPVESTLRLCKDVSCTPSTKQPANQAPVALWYGMGCPFPSVSTLRPHPHPCLKHLRLCVGLLAVLWKPSYW